MASPQSQSQPAPLAASSLCAQSRRILCTVSDTVGTSGAQIRANQSLNHLTFTARFLLLQSAPFKNRFSLIRVSPWFQALNEILVLYTLMTNYAGLLATLFQVGYQRISQPAVRPGKHFQSIYGVIVKHDSFGDDLFAVRWLRHLVRGHDQTDRTCSHLISDIGRVIVPITN